MLNLTRCTRCLMPDTRPDTEFINGICSACWHHDIQLKIDWTERKDDLHKLFQRQKHNGSGFDCIVASSGGKDSTCQVLSILEMGYRPLVVTATTCYLTDIGRKNIDNLKRFASTIEVTPNQEVRAKMNSLGLQIVGDISWPEHVAIFTTPMRVAAALGIPLVFYGENPQAAYGGPVDEQHARQMTQRWVSEFGGLLGLRMTDVVGKLGITVRDIDEYRFPSAAEIKRVGCEAHFLGQYLGPWNGRHNANVAIKHGFITKKPSISSWWEFENLDNAMTGIHDYFMFLKYGYGRACAQISIDIRSGYMSRLRGMEELRGLEGHLPATYGDVPIHKVLKRIGIKFADFLRLADQFTNHDLFDGEGNGTSA